MKKPHVGRKKIGLKKKTAAAKKRAGASRKTAGRKKATATSSEPQNNRANGRPQGDGSQEVRLTLQEADAQESAPKGRVGKA